MLNDGRTLVDPSGIDQAQPVAVEEQVHIAGRYRLLRLLGGGGMGNVYLAEDSLLARQVAIKTIRPELSAHPEVRSRIKREYRLHAAIGAHPQIVTLYDTVEENGHIYLVMEYVAGMTLASLLAPQPQQAVFSLTQSLDIVRQLLLALAAIHNAGIVHRDIKTANVLLQQRRDNQYLAKLTDFGIARAALEDESVTRLTSFAVQGPGTPRYMAPERIDPTRFGAIGPAADVYAVGIILYEMLTGQPPFVGTMTEIFSGHLVQPPAFAPLAEKYPPWVVITLETALAKQPLDRFASAEDFLKALKMDEAGPARVEQISAPEVASPEPEELRTLLAPQDEGADVEATLLHPRLAQQRVQRRRPGILLASITGILLILIGLGIYLLSPHGTAPAPEAGRPEVVAHGASSSVPSTSAKTNEPVLPQQPEPTAVSALETVETVRGRAKIESKTVPKRTEAPTSGEWEVVEDRSRKIR
jgi:serine/threonine-protein kinase